jgi:hypothetical protein
MFICLFHKIDCNAAERQNYAERPQKEQYQVSKTSSKKTLFCIHLDFQRRRFACSLITLLWSLGRFPLV